MLAHGSTAACCRCRGGRVILSSFSLQESHGVSHEACARPVLPSTLSGMGFFGRSQKRNRFSLSRGGGARTSGSLTDASDGSSRRNSTVAAPPPQPHQSILNTSEASVAQPTPAPPPTPERSKSLKTVAFAKAQLGRAGSWRRLYDTSDRTHRLGVLPGPATSLSPLPASAPRLCP